MALVSPLIKFATPKLRRAILPSVPSLYRCSVVTGACSAPLLLRRGSVLGEGVLKWAKPKSNHTGTEISSIVISRQKAPKHCRSGNVPSDTSSPSLAVTDCPVDVFPGSGDGHHQTLYQPCSDDQKHSQTSIKHRTFYQANLQQY